MKSHCPACNAEINGAFPTACPKCVFSINDLAGRGTSSFQTTKWNQHTDILQGRDVSLYGKKFNASFDFRGQANLDDLVRFTITYGDRSFVQSRGNTTPVIVCYTPEPIGSGTSDLFHPAKVACSGLCLMSPASMRYAHSYPVLDQWVQDTFKGRQVQCRLCGGSTGFGVPICATCQNQKGFDWRYMLANGI